MAWQQSAALCQSNMVYPLGTPPLYPAVEHHPLTQSVRAHASPRLLRQQNALSVTSDCSVEYPCVSGCSFLQSQPRSIRHCELKGQSSIISLRISRTAQWMSRRAQWISRRLRHLNVRAAADGSDKGLDTTGSDKGIDTTGSVNGIDTTGVSGFSDLEFLEGKPSLRPAARSRANRTSRGPRPKRIILVRHGESEGNVDEAAYTRIPDSRIALTQKGWDQAKECGRKIRELIEKDGTEDWKVYFYVSPYLRTIQTLRGLGLAFEKQRVAGVREEPRIREQDFGNFQCREKMRVEKQTRLRYGRFFYRFPDGESAADVYDRVTGFRETLRADIEVGRFQRPEYAGQNMNLVLVSHGLTLRVFLMRWFKWTVHQFEGLYNFDNASMMVMERGENGRYALTLHHSTEELRRFGMTEAMIADQDWQVNAKPGDLNVDWVTSGPSFFDHFDEDEEIIGNYICEGLSDGCVPEEILAMEGSSPSK